ncbi:hypothetical protein TWF694_003699 [Orbilia ellipsospora]|uniref:Uncharacterized protein n=1 Tax=Orbilia ellipsospora TaxID=2528407 RepID=A0AAV9X079_9PEZI
MVSIDRLRLKISPTYTLELRYTGLRTQTHRIHQYTTKTMCHGSQGFASNKENISGVPHPANWQPGSILYTSEGLTFDDIERSGSPTSSNDVGLSDGSDAEGESGGVVLKNGVRADWHNDCYCWNKEHEEYLCGPACFFPAAPWISKTARQMAN